MFRESPSREEAERETLLRLIEIEEGRGKYELKRIDAAQAGVASENLKNILRKAPVATRKRYLRAFVSETCVGKQKIVISGPEDAVAAAAHSLST